MLKYSNPAVFMKLFCFLLAKILQDRNSFYDLLFFFLKQDDTQTAFDLLNSALRLMQMTYIPDKHEHIFSTVLVNLATLLAK